MKISVVSGGFDPLHSGHIAYIENAKNLGDLLIVALNSDEWLVRKKGKFLLPFEERKLIIEKLEMVDKVIAFNDDDGSCSDALYEIIKMYPKDKVILCNGGDRDKNNIPELSVKGIEFAFGIGGNQKKNSSSVILKNFLYSSENRVWGKFFNLFEEKNIKVKELIISPNKGMSFQKHFHRNEIWFISKGSCNVNFSKTNSDDFEEYKLKMYDTFMVKKGEWHQIFNSNDYPCHIIEIQYGKKVSEEDIKRLRFYDQN